MFKNTVHEAQENAETQSQFGFDASEVDYGEGDEEMKEEEEVDVEIDVDEQDEDEEVDAQQEACRSRDRGEDQITSSLVNELGDWHQEDANQRSTEHRCVRKRSADL